MREMRLVDRIWWGSDPLARAARSALRPLEITYAGVTALRGRLYDAGLLAARPLAIPSVSVGNLTVGGTGKTPVSAWLCGELRERGVRPAVVLRGYGGDEPVVHSMLNPDVPVVVAAERASGVARAQRLGAQVAVLDDAFQHRRVARDADIVLLSAERWTTQPRLLPAGPWREPLRALRRATLVLVTRKAATRETANRVVRDLERLAPDAPAAVAHLALSDVRAARGTGQFAMDALRGATVHAVAAVGDPEAFFQQLEAAGARVRRSPFPDHHPFTATDAQRLARASRGADLVVCTLKDAVKLGPLWPREAAPLWYVSQRVHLEHGGAAVDALLSRLVASCSVSHETAGRRRPTDDRDGCRPALADDKDRPPR